MESKQLGTAVLASIWRPNRTTSSLLFSLKGISK
jgi:hypothetical protein